MNLTFEQLLTLLTLIGTGIAFLFAKPTLDAVMRFGDWWRAGRERRLELEAKHRKQLMEEEKQRQDHLAHISALDSELNDKGYKIIVRRQDRRITELEKERNHCHESLALLNHKFSELAEENRQARSDLELLKNRLDLLAPGISDASDSKVARYFKRLAARRGKVSLEDSSGELDLGNKD